MSVTQVLDYFTEPDLLAWYQRVGWKEAEHISQEAKTMGSEVDQLVRQAIRGVPIEAPTKPGILTCWQGWQRFLNDFPKFPASVQALQVELTDGEVVGHADFFVEEGHRWGIVDLKTGTRVIETPVRPKYWTQVAKYHQMKASSMPSTRPSFIGVLRLDKAAGLYHYQEITDPQQIAYEVGVFNHYLAAYQHGQKVREFFRHSLESEVLGVA